MSDTSKKTYTVPEAASALGVSAAHVYRLCERGELRHTRLGKKLLIPASVVASLLAGNRPAHE